MVLRHYNFHVIKSTVVTWCLFTVTSAPVSSVTDVALADVRSLDVAADGVDGALVRSNVTLVDVTARNVARLHCEAVEAFTVERSDAVDADSVHANISERRSE